MKALLILLTAAILGTGIGIGIVKFNEHRTMAAAEANNSPEMVQRRATAQVLDEADAKIRAANPEKYREREQRIDEIAEGVRRAQGD